VRGRPTKILNLVGGVTCRIRGEINPSGSRYWTIEDNSNIIWLGGRTAGIRDRLDAEPGEWLVFSLIGHRAKTNERVFIVEEIE